MYTVGIIGAGRIGCGFDTPDFPAVLTHAHAIMRHPHFELAALVDADAAKGEMEARKWGTRFFTDIESMFAEVQPDVLVIAAPDAMHARLLAQTAKYDPKLIICEKPVATTEADMALLKQISVPVIVNFSRRFDSTTSSIRDRLRRGEFGIVLTASGTYTRGVVHNGSHMIDLARFLFGEVTGITAVRPGVPDYPAGEDSIGGMLSLERCERFFLMPADARAYTVFEMDIFTEKARIRFTDECQTIVMQDIIDDPIYTGYRILGDERRDQTSLLRSLETLYEHALAVIEQGEEIHSSLSSALATNAACLSIVEEYKKM